MNACQRHVPRCHRPHGPEWEAYRRWHWAMFGAEPRPDASAWLAWQARAWLDVNPLPSDPSDLPLYGCER